MSVAPRTIGFILSGFVAGVAGIYFFNSWRKGSGSADGVGAVNEVFVGEDGDSDGDETY